MRLFPRDADPLAVFVVKLMFGLLALSACGHVAPHVYHWLGWQ